MKDWKALSRVIPNETGFEFWRAVYMGSLDC